MKTHALILSLSKDEATFSGLFSILLSLDTDFHRHALEGVGRSDETASHGHDLPDVARDGDRDQIEAANTAVRRIEGDPARTGHIDFRPGMGRPRPRRVPTTF